MMDLIFYIVSVHIILHQKEPEFNVKIPFADPAGKDSCGKLFPHKKPDLLRFLRDYDIVKHRFSTMFSTECGKIHLIFLEITAVLRLTRILPLAIIYKV